MNHDQQGAYFPDGDLIFVADRKSEASALPYLDVKMTNNWKHDAKNHIINTTAAGLIHGALC